MLKVEAVGPKYHCEGCGGTLNVIRVTVGQEHYEIKIYLCENCGTRLGHILLAECDPKDLER